MPESVKILDSKKFMWDGQSYESEQRAKEVAAGYEGNNFEVRVIQEEGKFLIYTRRGVTQIVIEGQAPV